MSPNRLPLQTCKWTAFCLLFAMPGLGQLFVGSWWCLPWLTLGGGSIVAMLALSSLDASGDRFLLAFGSACVALASAVQAKRLCEPRRDANSSRILGAEIQPPRIRGRSVALSLVLRTRFTRSELWERIADLPRFLTIDPLHDEIVLMRTAPAAGVDLVLWHAVPFFRFPRFGRILSWRPGEGYAFSDLSARGTHCGFPHAFIISIDDGDGGGPGESSCARLTICVRGRWTNPVVPLWLGRWWLEYIAREHARLLRQAW